MESLSKIQQHVQQVPDLKAGVALVGAGAGGSFAQAITEWANIFVTVGNVVLVIGGIYLFWCKIKDRKRKDRSSEDA
jgi:ABC-type enterobactin transport system permease subunit